MLRPYFLYCKEMRLPHGAARRIDKSRKVEYNRRRLGWNRELAHVQGERATMNLGSIGIWYWPVVIENTTGSDSFCCVPAGSGWRTLRHQHPAFLFHLDRQSLL